MNDGEDGGSEAVPASCPLIQDLGPQSPGRLPQPYWCSRPGWVPHPLPLDGLGVPERTHEILRLSR